MPGRRGLSGPEHLHRDAVGRDAAGGQRAGEVVHERAGAAHVEIGLGGRDAARVDHIRGEPSGDVEAGVAGVGPAVANDAVGVRQLREQFADLRRERVLGAVASALQPPHRPRRALGRQHVEHREHGGRADAGAEERHRASAFPEHELAAGRAGLELITDVQLVVDVVTAGAMGLALDADPIARGVRRVRQRVGPQQRRGRRVRAQAHGQELARQRGRGRFAVGGLEPHRDHARALAVDLGDSQLPQPRPGRWRRRGRLGRAVEQLAERSLPSLAERGDAERPDQVGAGPVRQIQQAVDVGHGHRLGAALQALDRVAGLDLALLEHAEVEAGAPVGDDERWHLRLVHPDAEAVTGDPRLADLEHRRADPVAVSDADLVVGQSLRR